MSRTSVCAALVALLLTASTHAQRPRRGPRPVPAGNPSVMTVADLELALRTVDNGGDARALADRLRAWFGADAIKTGARARVQGLDAAWAYEAPGLSEPPAVLSDDGKFHLILRRVGDTDVYAGVAHLAEGAGMRWHYDAGGKAVGGDQLEVYSTPPEEKPDPAIPHGIVTKEDPFESKVFAGTHRSWWIYVPAQYKPENPAAVMVFQDGGSYVGYVPTVFDHLIASGDMPVTVGIFVDPGTFTDGRSDRSFEYDTLSDQYARFLIDEILPAVEKRVHLRSDPSSRAVGGASSGGICSFTVAWERPDAFGKVMSWIGSFTNLAAGKTLREGGHNYPALIRRVQPHKPIRVFLQDGENDLDNFAGNWPLANQSMAKALAFAGYDYKFVFGHGFHSHSHGRSIFPDTLRWLWRGTR